MSGPEFSPVKYTESEDCKYFEKITHKFKFKSEDVKCEMPIYDDEHPELFIKLVNEYWNMAETYELFAEDKTLFDRFRRCLRSARADWDIIVNGITLDKATLTTSLKELLIEIVGEDAEDNLTDYMERTSKPRTLKCRHWIRRIRHMNIYLGQIAGSAKKYSDKRLIRNIIAPNIP